ncbi:uncharacterized protein J3D65DRAFT_671059 [Phyllosticta citribraziliensis]|uniref:GPI anchored serine-threonine rich protein n=1 Tax=Phyllosticta citribraziliensis TaxID=989973 RepID=A0ABR1LB62_9PEZI
MRFSLAAFALASVALVAAQSTPSAAPTGGACAAQNILDTCLAGEKAKADACAGNDWLCLCDTYNSILTCYNNCPNDAARSSVNNQVTQFCGAAAPALSSRSEAAKTAPKTTSSPSATGTGAAATGTNKSNFEGFGSSSTGSASGAQGTGAALAVGQFAGGALAAVGVVVGMLWWRFEE